MLLRLIAFRGRLHGQPNPHQMQSSSEAVQYTKEFLRECPTDEYLIVTQPGVNAADLRQSEGCAMPHLCKAIDDSRVRGKYIVAEVIGNITDADFQDHIKSSCARKGRTAKVVRAPLELLSGSRAKSLAKNGMAKSGNVVMCASHKSVDEKLAKTISTLSTRNSYTILFHATPQEPLYNSEFIEPLHTHMKRSDGNTLASKRANETQRDTRPLFEKYQFFTPGAL